MKDKQPDLAGLTGPLLGLVWPSGMATVAAGCARQGWPALVAAVAAQLACLWQTPCWSTHRTGSIHRLRLMSVVMTWLVHNVHGTWKVT